MDNTSPENQDLLVYFVVEQFVPLSVELRCYKLQIRILFFRLEQKESINKAISLMQDTETTRQLEIHIHGIKIVFKRD